MTQAGDACAVDHRGSRGGGLRSGWTGAATKRKRQQDVADTRGVECQDTRGVQDDSRVFGLNNWKVQWHKLSWGSLGEGTGLPMAERLGVQFGTC